MNHYVYGGRQSILSLKVVPDTVLLHTFSALETAISIISSSHLMVGFHISNHIYANSRTNTLFRSFFSCRLRLYTWSRPKTFRAGHEALQRDGRWHGWFLFSPICSI